MPALGKSKFTSPKTQKGLQFKRLETTQTLEMGRILTVFNEIGIGKVNSAGKISPLKTALSLCVALGAVIAYAQEDRISEECYIPSCPGHRVPTSRDSATRVKLTPKQCKVEKVCQSVLLSIREMEATPASCNLEFVQSIQDQIATVEKEVKALQAKTKVDVLGADGRPVMGQILEIELESKLAQCESAGLFPRWEKNCIGSNCTSYLSYIDGLAVDKASCKANDGGVQGIVLKGEKYVVGQKLQEYLNKCRTANLIPAKVGKGKESYYSELAKRKEEFEVKLAALEAPVSSGFFSHKVTVPGETFNQLMTRVDTLEVNSEQCNKQYEKALRKSVNSYDRLFKKYSEFSGAELPQVERALEKIEFHTENCKRRGLQ